MADDLGIVETELIEANGGWREVWADEAEITLVQFAIAFDLGSRCSRPAGFILRAIVKFAREEEHVQRFWLFRESFQSRMKMREARCLNPLCSFSLEPAAELRFNAV